ncbi:MAG TPA: type I-U CRISPR-associated helicase/endonuclease Cas3 [Pirellulales bacterium]|nr:type I-U CRISPR-associated helicase/endonuclease Cas3 [Pirellulales bacterium]
MTNELKPSDFCEFFGEIYKDERGRPIAPFPWQRRLARRVCEGNWPAFIDLPTASGKTACLDIAVFALAVQASRKPGERTVGRRIFFVVNRRVIVDEAYGRAMEIAKRLAQALDNPSDSILRRVAAALRKTSGDTDAPPLDVAMLRGGLVRDNRWARSVTQPTIITSTIDQVGSRLLFRGYGVSPEAAPMHAALIAHDSTILLDEAHISQPFVETLQAVRRYRSESWAHEAILTPFHFVQMTATPGDPVSDVFRLDDEDREHPVLTARHGRAKPIRLHVAERAKGKKAIDELAAEIVARAIELQNNQPHNIAIVVNRIATARAAYERLKNHFRPTTQTDEPPAAIHLAIGRMRPLDRDELTQAIQLRVGKTRGATAGETKPMFVVATQCLEVGADFDFDAMVCECASLDAIRQRFGRLNRRGRDIDARGYIVIRADQTEGDDPIYGSALATTWQWLQSIASDSYVDFGVNAMNSLLEEVKTMPLLAPRAGAPIMFPAYLDAWGQTNPIPVPDPDVSLFLHGPQRGEPDVNVCWRDDLPENSDQWIDTVNLSPPSSPECMSVPIGLVRDWLAGKNVSDEQRSDLFDAPPPESTGERGRTPSVALAWRGSSRSTLILDSADLRPGDMVVLPVSAGGWDFFGHIPDSAPRDVAERAYRQSRGRAILRLRPERLEGWPKSQAIDRLCEWLVDTESDLHRDDLRDLLRQAADAAHQDQREVAETMRVLAAKKNGLDEERYPDEKGVVLRTRKRVPTTAATIILPAMDDGEDETSRVARENPVSLEKHLLHVRHEIDAVVSLLPVRGWAEALQRAADLHDWGKADERFQALLINGDRNDAGAQPALWAKSGRMPNTTQQCRLARERSGLPEGFRHEVLSVQLAELVAGCLPTDKVMRDLTLHLIAAHHGRARPLAPVVVDDEPSEVNLESLGIIAMLTAEQRKENPPHRLDSGIAERFWTLSRRFGWWGLAYLETTLRLADQRASQREEQEVMDGAPQRKAEEVLT